MLTTVPFKTFISLNNGTLKEAKARNTFSLKRLKSIRNPYTIVEYLRSCGAVRIGEGSAREVFGLNNGMIPGIKGPACIKVVSNSDRGPAQNKAEIKILNRFQHKHECFPILYDYPEDHMDCPLYMIVELGTCLAYAPDSFIERQFEPFKEMIYDFLSENGDPTEDGIYRDYLANITTSFPYFMTTMTEILTDQAGNSWGDDYSEEEVIWILNFIHEIKNSTDPITYSMYDTLKFASKKVARSFLFGDFCQPENWGFVCRNGYYMLIPIDWGFTRQVAYNFY